MLSQQQVESYFRDGQVTAAVRLSDEVIRAIAAKIEAFLEFCPNAGADYYPALIESDRTWLEFATLPEILDAAEQLIGPDIIVWSSALFCKSPGRGKATPWHQDAQYWPIRPLETTTVWIAVDAATRENGCMQIVPGSHRTRNIYPHSVNDSDTLVLNQELDSTLQTHLKSKHLLLDRGMFSFHDAYLLHGAELNRSDKRRAALTFRYMPASSHFDRDLARKMAAEQHVNDVSERQLFQVRGTECHAGNLLSAH